MVVSERVMLVLTVYSAQPYSAKTRASVKVKAVIVDMGPTADIGPQDSFFSGGG